jgi:DNA-binding NarL/FixJ family response regulator
MFSPDQALLGRTKGNATRAAERAGRIGEASRLLALGWPPKKVARHMGLHERTVRDYQAALKSENAE